MDNAIKITPNLHGTYRYIRNIDASLYSETDWLHNPDLTSVAGIPEKYWKVVAGSPLSVAEMSQGEKDAVDADIKDTENYSVAGELAFEKSGTCKNRWLGFGASKSSNSVPFIIPHKMTVTALTFTNIRNSSDSDVEIYQNGIKVFTWEIRSKRWSWKTQGLHDLSFVAGDKISVYMRDKGTDPKHVIITLHYTIWGHEVGEGGSSIL